ncbi:hypothetical protein ACFJIS_14905 [Variovorax boronicumulans]
MHYFIAFLFSSMTAALQSISLHPHDLVGARLARMHSSTVGD